MREIHLRSFLFCLLLSIACLGALSASDDKVSQQTFDVIRREATSLSIDYPLPLFTHWYTSTNHANGFDLEQQLDFIEGGLHWLPNFEFNRPDSKGLRLIDRRALNRIAKHRLPITVISTQWERYLTDWPDYFDLPVDDNPNVISLDGDVLKELSPFGPTKYWYEIGRRWAQSKSTIQMQNIYPEPPLIVFLSNNEHKKLRAKDVEKSKRFIETYGNKLNDEEIRELLCDKWSEKYQALIKGLREGLISDTWRENSVFIGFNIYETNRIGRNKYWKESLYHKSGTLEYLLAWDGESHQEYFETWTTISDFQVFSMQTGLMNHVPYLELLRKRNPNYWFEISFWDGYNSYDKTGTSPDKKYHDVAINGKPLDAERVEGLVQYMLWLTRPRALREFGWRVWDGEKILGNTAAQIRAIERIYHHEVLQDFWRKGKLLANPNDQNPYVTDVPQEIQLQKRWYLLDCDQNNFDPKNYDSPIYVFSLAHEVGVTPNRKWLVYAHSPFGMTNADVFIPGYQKIKIECSKSGVFNIIHENPAHQDQNEKIR